MKTRTAALATLMCLATLQTSIALARVGGAVSQTGDAVLTVSNGLANQPGGVNPLSGATLALLRESFESILRKTHLFDGQPSPLRAWHTACASRSPSCKKALGNLEESVVAEGQMNTNGRMTFPDVPPGTYYLLALTMSAPTAQSLIWDLRVELKPGANSVTLDQRNVAALDIRAARTAPRSIEQPGGGDTAARSEKMPAAPARPSGPKNSVLTLSATDGPRKPVARTSFYLLDDDFEKILQRAGFKQQMLLGKPLPLLNSFEFVARMVALKKNDPRFAIFEGLAGESFIPAEIEQQYNLGLQALTEHIVATARTDAGGHAIAPAVPAGAYYLYGTTSEFVKVGEVVTIDRSTPTPTITNSRPYGYDSATIWNMKVAVKAGRNSITLTQANAAFVTGR